MIALREPAEQHIVLHNISWAGYESILDAIGETHLRVTYDDGDLEIMTLSFGHENAGEWIGRLIFFLALELKMPLCSGGSTTLKKSLNKKGLEPDKCFWLQNENAMRGKKEWNPRKDPPPDLAVEVDVKRSALNRLGIYAALQVPEIWHYDGDKFEVLILGPDGKYKAKLRSRTFPSLSLKEFAARFIIPLGTVNEVELIDAFTKWIRETMLRKNGKNATQC